MKTPRPDITIGLRNTTVIARMKAKGLRESDAKHLLKSLQYGQALSPNPLQPAFPICFPPMVVEGKSYSTGKPVFEAQNQAVVSGSCMINLQHQLAELTERTSPGTCTRKEPLAFSICTECPIIQLWVHYTTLVDDVRTYNMNILKICHPSRRQSLRKDVESFFEAVNGVMDWAVSALLDDIVGQLVVLGKLGRERAP